MYRSHRKWHSMKDKLHISVVINVLTLLKKIHGKKTFLTLLWVPKENPRLRNNLLTSLLRKLQIISKEETLVNEEL